MNKRDIKLRIIKLIDEIKIHNDLYYNKDKPSITDAEYDKLNTQLESIILIKEICRIHDKCPHHKQIPLHNHYSMMYHFNTLDNSIAGDILVFMRNNIK